MKMIAMSLAGLVLLGASASAQTIIGESTYEDNFQHTPPPAPVEVPARPATGPTKAYVPPAERESTPPDLRR